MNKDGGYHIEEIHPGMAASFTKTITEADILMFAAVSGDTNPVHINAEYAKTTQFGERIAHGMLSASLISCVLGTRLPGPGAIYLGQTLKFKAPVHIGDTVTATLTVREVLAAKKRLTLDAVCTIAGKVVLAGESVVMCSSEKD